MATDGDKLGGDLESTEFRHGVDQSFWGMAHRTDAAVYVRLFAPDDRSYLACFTCENYGEEPLDCKFVDTGTHECMEAAWPRGDAAFEQWIKFKHPNLFICWEQDAGGLKHHPEWRVRKAWMKSKNPIVTYLNFLRERLWLPMHGYLHQAPLKQI